MPKDAAVVPDEEDELDEEEFDAEELELLTSSGEEEEDQQPEEDPRKASRKAAKAQRKASRRAGKGGSYDFKEYFNWLAAVKESFDNFWTIEKLVTATDKIILDYPFL